MDGNSEGTPNPLNPMSGDASAANTPQPDTSVAPEAPATFGTPVTPEAPVSTATPETANMPETTNAPEATNAPESTPESPSAPETPATPEAPAAPKTPVVKPASYSNRSVVDPMMRPVSHRDSMKPNAGAANLGTLTNAPANNNFDTLGVDENTISEITRDATPRATTPAPNPAGADLVAKDSVVDSGKKGKKKALIIGGIVLLIVAIICGAAAIAIAVIGNKDDRVPKAIDKLTSGEVSNIIHAQGYISSSNSENETSYNIGVNGTLDTKSGASEVEANVTANLANGNELELTINELSNKNGDSFFKISGISDILKALTNPSIDYTETSEAIEGTAESTVESTVENVAELTEATNDINSTVDNCAEAINCVTTTTSSLSDLSGTLSIFSGVIDTIDDQWIAVSSDFSESVENLNIFDNSSVCVINAFGTLSQYASDIANKYKANPFVTYSTDNLKVSKKRNTLYRLGIDDNKLPAFANSLGNNGFINELYACSGNATTNSGASATFIKEIFDSLPAVYVEIDDNYNITRVYFEIVNDVDGAITTIKADLDLSYPKEFQITEPEEYIEMSTLVSNLMMNVLNGGEVVDVTDVVEITE